MENLAQTLSRLKKLRKELSEFTALSDEALTVFKPFISVMEVKELYDDVWQKKLFQWNRTFDKHFGYLDIQDYSEISKTFALILDATINKKQFSAMLAKTREGIEEYIQSLQSEVAKEEDNLNKFYDALVKSCGNLAFIFESSTIKELIINWLLNSNTV